MAIGIFCVYAVLVLLFHDFLQPLTILSALPLALGGAVVALLITGSSSSMPTVIGFVLLMGIVTKNSILPGGIRHRGSPRTQSVTPRSIAGCLPQARSPHRDDDHRTDCGHAANCDGSRRRSQFSSTHGHRRDRRCNSFHGTKSNSHSGSVY